MVGFLLIDKPDGMTSHDVVNRVRRLTGEKRVGHAGTLDPFATGLLIVGVGREATREFSKLVGLDKEYEAIFAFGATSDTDDRTGTVVPTPGVGSQNYQHPVLVPAAIKAAMKKLTGPIEQIPPAYSAIKIGGKKMYEAAREGTPLEAKPRSVTIHSFDLLDSAPNTPKAPTTSKAPLFPFRIRCSSGTYIRSLARDLGAALGTGGYVEELRRTAVGPFHVQEATPLSTLSAPSALSALSPIPLPLIPVPDLLSRLSSSATVSP